MCVTVMMEEYMCVTVMMEEYMCVTVAANAIFV